MNAQTLTLLAEKLMAMDNKYQVAQELNKLYADAKLEGMRIVKEITVKK